MSKDTSLLPAYNALIKTANQLLTYKPVSVMDKTDVPPSGNKHDYMSIGPYWWPNPNTPNGLPYIRKDGEVNPEVKNFPDKENMPKLCENIYNLSLAYYFSNDEKYAKHASKLLQVWFLDSATKMNPNLNYGQAIKGVTEGRAEGIIDTRQFIFALDGVALLKGSKDWTNEKDAALKQWFSQFLNWLNTSKIGKDEMDANNNHGVWFDAQALAIALYVGNTTMANEIVGTTAKRLDAQANNEGLFPLELQRTTSLHYSVFIMNAFTIVAQLSEQTSTNFWTLETPSGKSFKKCVEAIIPFITKQKEWTYPEIKPFQVTDAYPLLLHAGNKYKHPKYLDFIKTTTKGSYDKLLLNLF
ncbi:MAG: alginate lyase family protein [Flavobacterium sp.]|nr:alginate lyase family protein [Flavobacterium sp.]